MSGNEINIEQIEKSQILQKCVQDFCDNGMNAVFQSSLESGGMSPDMLVTVISQYALSPKKFTLQAFFTPSSFKSDHEEYLNVIIMPADTLEGGHLRELTEVIPVMNLSLLAGAFFVESVTGSLIYRLCLPVSLEDDSQSLYLKTNMAIAHAIDIAETSMGILLMLYDGKVSVSDVLSQFGEA